MFCIIMKGLCFVSLAAAFEQNNSLKSSTANRSVNVFCLHLKSEDMELLNKVTMMTSINIRLIFEIFLCLFL